MLYVLKKLFHRQAWADQHVHHAIHTTLTAVRNQQESQSADRAVEHLLEAMRTDFKDSRRHTYREATGKAVGLFEHEYEVDVPDTEWKRLAEEAAACVHAFFALPILADLRNLSADSWLALETFLSIDMDNLPVRARFDLVYRDGESVMICDWKTASSLREDNGLQAMCYALVAHHHWDVAPENIRVRMVYLPNGHVEESAPRVEQLAETRDFIHESADEMLFLLADVERNIPNPEDFFDYTEHTDVCRTCNFLKVCPKWQQF